LRIGACGARGKANQGLGSGARRELYLDFLDFLDF